MELAGKTELSKPIEDGGRQFMSESGDHALEGSMSSVKALAHFGSKMGPVITKSDPLINDYGT